MPGPAGEPRPGDEARPGARAGREPDAPGTREGRGRPPRLDPLAVRRQLREAGLRARHSLSQNFLADPDTLQAIVDLASPARGARILEIGPGLGILTGGLLGAGAAVTAVELDRGLADRLERVHADAIERAASDPDSPGSLSLVRGDILDQRIPELVRPPYEVVANVPYHITSPILHRFLEAPPRPERLILMVQREVAERMAADAGAMSYLSVFVQYHAAVRVALAVPRDAFEPAPDVDSAVVVLEPHEPASGALRPEGGAAGPLAPPLTLRLAPEAEADLWRLVQAAFHERRKMLRNVLSRQLPMPMPSVDAALAKVAIEGDRRPQTLSVGEWLALLDALGPLPRARVAPERTVAARGENRTTGIRRGRGGAR